MDGGRRNRAGAIGALAASALAQMAFQGGGYYNSTKAFKSSKAAGTTFTEVAKQAARVARKKAKARAAPKTKTKKVLKEIKHEIRNLKAYDRTGQGEHTHREIQSYSMKSAVNAQACLVVGEASYTWQLEQVIKNLKFFDPSNPSTLLTADLGAGTYARNIMFKSISSFIECRNNYKVPCDLDVYLCKVKDDTNNSPLIAWSAACADNGNLTNTQQLGQYPTDYNLVNDLWKLKLAHKGRLEAGESIKLFHGENDIEIDPATMDSHTLTYQKEWKSYCFLFIVKGVIGHDSVVATEQTLLPAGVDIYERNVYNIVYNAGAHLKRIHVVNNMDATFTTDGLLSNKPQSVNQIFSYA